MSQKRSFASTIGGAVAGRYFGMALTFLTSSIISHSFGKDSLGYYATAFGLASTLCYFLGLGAPEGVARLAALHERHNTEHRRRLAKIAHWLALSTGTGAASIAIVVSIFASPPEEIANTIFTILWILGWGLNVSASLCLIALGHEKTGSFYFYTAGALGNFIFVSSAILITRSSQYILAVSSCSYLLLGIVATFQVLAQQGLTPKTEDDSKHALNLVLAGAPFTGARVIQSTALWLPVWGAGILSGPGAAGVMWAVMRLSFATGAAMAAIRLILRRIIPDLLSSGHRRRLTIIVSVSGTIFTIVTLFIVAGVAVFGDFGMRVLFGKEFSGHSLLLCFALAATAAESQFGTAEDIIKNRGGGVIVMLVQAGAIVVSYGPMFVLQSHSLWSYVGGYVAYVAITQIVYVIWLGLKEGIWIRPMITPHALRIFMRVRP